MVEVRLADVHRALGVDERLARLRPRAVGEVAERHHREHRVRRLALGHGAVRRHGGFAPSTPTSASRSPRSSTMKARASSVCLRSFTTAVQTSYRLRGLPFQTSGVRAEDHHRRGTPSSAYRRRRSGTRAAGRSGRCERAPYPCPSRPAGTRAAPRPSARPRAGARRARSRPDDRFPRRDAIRGRLDLGPVVGHEVERRVTVERGRLRLGHPLDQRQSDRLHLLVAEREHARERRPRVLSCHAPSR